MIVLDIKKRTWQKQTTNGGFEQFNEKFSAKTSGKKRWNSCVNHWTQRSLIKKFLDRDFTKIRKKLTQKLYLFFL